MSAPLRIRINRLVLHGVDPRDRVAIGEAVRAEIARVFGQRGPDVPSPHSRIGREVARAVKKEIPGK